MKAKSFTVRDGNCAVRISPWKNPKGADYWRFGWKDGDRWRYVTRKDREEIKVAARTVLEQLNQGFVYDALSQEEKKYLREIHRLTRPADREAVLRWIEDRNRTSAGG